MLPDNDTIVALATPQGVAGVGVIRLSGSHSLSIISSCISLKKNLLARRVYNTSLLDPDTDQVIDQICLIYFQAPSSFTGEDVIEIHCHSSIYIIKRILSVCMKKGARAALKGEFSKRAFVNGKMDLTQAESMIDLIHSQTQMQHQVSLNRVEGKLYRHVMSIRETFMRYFEQLEGSIDFPDEVPAIDHALFSKDINDSKTFLAHIVSIQDQGKYIAGGIHCVLVGKPNVGKSSMFNALLGEDRSIVTDIAGTTRDYIKESVQYEGVLCHFYDTAGLCDSSDVVEYLGMEAVKGLLEKADIICWVTDGSQKLDTDDDAVSSLLSSYKQVIHLRNKSDLEIVTDSKRSASLTCSIFDDRSIEKVKEYIFEQCCQRLSDHDLELLCNIRQQRCIEEIYARVCHLSDMLNQGLADDALTIDVRDIITLCSECVGDDITEEMLDGVFSRFCVGK